MWRKALAEGMADKITKEDMKAAVPDPVPLAEDEVYKAVVTGVDDSPAEVLVMIGHSRGRIGKKDMAWAGKYKKDSRPPVKLKKPSDVLVSGDLVLVKVLGVEQDDKGVVSYRLGLEQETIIQAGLISLATRSGHVKALCGGIKSQFIRPIQGKRQPGSAFKPIVYAAALDDPKKRFTPATILLDSAMVFDIGEHTCGIEIYERYKPKNYDGSFSGHQTFRQALAKSINTIAVRIGCNLEIPYVVDYAKELGIKSRLDMLPCLPLGCSELTLGELSTAYNVFATGGYLMEPVYIARVYDRDGNLLEYEERLLPKSEEEAGLFHEAGDLSTEGDTIEGSPEEAGADTVSGAMDRGFEEEDIFSEEPRPVARARRHYYLNKPVPPQQLGEPTWEGYLAEIQSPEHDWLDPITAPPRGNRVISSQTAFLINSMLESVVRWGTGTRARKLGRPVAGKTGTTNNSRDALFIGYSPELLAGVWVGSDDYSYSLGKGMTGGKAALPIWIEYMEEMLSDRPKVEFPVPKGITWVKIDISDGLRASDCSNSENIRTEAFIKGTEPEEYTPCHNFGTPGLPDLDRILDP